MRGHKYYISAVMTVVTVIIYIFLKSDCAFGFFIHKIQVLKVKIDLVGYINKYVFI